MRKIIPFFALAIIAINFSCNKPEYKEIPLTQFVNPFVGTDGHGHTYPGASMPFGMVQLSPDSRLEGWDGCSGYHYSDTLVYGFSHTHLSGTGCSDYGDILFMPYVGEPRLGEKDKPCSHFSHDNEAAKPGYYKTTLGDYNIDVELTVTKRAGFHKYIFPKSDEACIFVDLKHRDKVIDSEIKIISDTEIEGFRRSKAWAYDQHIYFYAKFSKAFDSHTLVLNDSIENYEKSAEGENIKSKFIFKTTDGESILVKVGISAVSTEGARKNLEAEISGWDFANTKSEADKAWNKELNKIQVNGRTEEHKQVFYTALYHSLLAPNLYQDVDGNYRGRDLEIHNATDHEYFTVFSLWDTYRAAHPLFTIIDQKRTNDFIKTMLLQYQQGGKLPVWELGACETGCMIGYHSVPVIADAFMKGIKDYDVQLALEAMKNSANQENLGLNYVQSCAYIPMHKEHESVSKALEYAYDDWCIAQMAKELKSEDDYANFIQRAQYYKNTQDPTTGFMRARENGGWQTPFDPKEVNFNFTEANSWQYSFYVPHDISGFMANLGGKERFIEQLDGLFNEETKTTGREQSDISGLIGQYAHGNEPSHHMAYLYNYANQPWKTQKIVSMICDSLYTSKADGLCGNEDCGQMSAWYVFSAMGFYPVCPGQDFYVIGTPIFDTTVINLENGKQFSVIAKDVSKENIYIQSAELNGKTYAKSYLKHEAIMKGGKIIFQMGSEPNKDWGVKEEDIPSSQITENLIQPIPYIKNSKITFKEKRMIEIAVPTKDSKIHYTLDGSDASEKSTLYTQPFEINETLIIKAIATNSDGVKSKQIEAEFIKIKSGRSINILSKYDNQYTAGGDDGLIDYIYGGENFRHGSWQGYQEQDFEAIVDLGKKEKVNKIAANFHQDAKSWIWHPEYVEFWVSDDGKNFKKLTTIDCDVSQKKMGAMTKLFSENFENIETRYVKVFAKSIMNCPEWHLSPGGRAWIFIDEIVVE